MIVTTKLFNVHSGGNGVQIERVDIEPFGLDDHLDKEVKELTDKGWFVTDQRREKNHPAVKANKGTTNLHIEVWRNR